MLKIDRTGAEHRQKGFEMKAYERLQDLTGRESGIIEYEPGVYTIMNWSSYDGIPRMLEPVGFIAMGETFTAKHIAMPAHLKRAMMKHARDEGTKEYVSGYHAWEITAGDETLTVAINNWWN